MKRETGVNKPWTEQQIAFVRKQVSTMNARVIGEAIGRTTGAVQQMRARLGLDKPQKAKNERFVSAVRHGHAAGLSDSEVAAKIGGGMSREVVRACRHRQALPANGWNERQRERTRQRTREQLRRAGLSNLGEVRKKAFEDYAKRFGWPADLPPRCVQILEILFRQGPKTRQEIAGLLGLKWMGSRTSLKGSCEGGSYLALLHRRALVLPLKRAVKRKGKGRSVWLYTLPLTIERFAGDDLKKERKVS